MALGGRRPTATVIKLATGKHGRIGIPEGEPIAEGAPIKPPKLKGRVSALWDEVVERAPWLTSADSYKLHVWCALHAEFERAPRKMVAAMIAQLRNAGSELGLDPGSRARLGTKPAPKADPANKYLA